MASAVRQRIRIAYREHRQGEDVAVFETPSRARTVLPAWMLDAGLCAAMTLGPPRAAISSLVELRSLLGALGFDRPASHLGGRSGPMKALPPPTPQLELLPRRRDLVLTVVEPSARHEILRALAEILLAAAEVAERKEVGDEAR